MRSAVGAFWPGACLLDDLLLVCFPDLVTEFLPLDLLAADFPRAGAAELTAPDLLETVRCLDDLAVPGFAADPLVEGPLADPEVAPA
jgi:hypothetical protein